MLRANKYTADSHFFTSMKSQYTPLYRLETLVIGQTLEEHAGVNRRRDEDRRATY